MQISQFDEVPEDYAKALDAADTLQAFLQTQHWQTHITQRDHHTIVMQASRNNETINLFLVSNEQSEVELTMIVAP